MNKKFQHISIGALLGIAYVFLQGTIFMLGVIVITGIILAAYLPKPDRRFLMTLFIWGMSAKFILCLTLYTASVFSGGNGEFTPDSRLYFLRALSNLRVWLGQTEFPFQVEGNVGQNSYLYVLSFFYWLIGYNPLIPNPVSIFSVRLINCLIGTLSGIPAFYMAGDIFGKRVAKFASIFTVFYPSVFFWSMTNSREPSNILLIYIIVFSLVRFQKNRNPLCIILLFLSLLLLKTIRPYSFTISLVAALGSLIIIFMGNLKRNFILIFCAVILTMTFLNVTTHGRHIKNRFLNFNVYIDRLYNSNQDILSEGGPTYKIYDDDFLYANHPSKELKLIKAFLKGAVYFICAPFPWAMSSAIQILAYPQMITWYLMFPFIFIGIFLAIRHRLRVSFSMFFYIFISTFSYALAEGNVATTMRHRDLITGLYLIFFAAGLVKILNAKELFGAKESNEYPHPSRGSAGKEHFD